MPAKNLKLPAKWKSIKAEVPKTEKCQPKGICPAKTIKRWEKVFKKILDDGKEGLTEWDPINLHRLLQKVS